MRYHVLGAVRYLVLRVILTIALLVLIPITLIGCAAPSTAVITGATSSASATTVKTTLQLGGQHAPCPDPARDVPLVDPAFLGPARDERRAGPDHP